MLRLFFSIVAATILLAIPIWRSCADIPVPGFDPKDAPEQVDVKVLDVSKRVTENTDILIRWDVEVSAEVRHVHATKCGLAPGKRIVIRYSAHIYKQRGWAGPSSERVLVKGEVCTAALGSDGELSFIPYARGSFSTPAQKK